jgi:acyl-coenzyme A synthetase/AMP-(fatty) acid ligase
MTGIALLRAPDRRSPFARRDGQDISVASFLGDVASLAAMLPNCDYVANLTRDRYRFAVGFAAALCRGQVTLLPPSEAPGSLAAVLESYGNVYCLTDAPITGPAPVFAYPETLAHGPAPQPHFTADQPAAILFTSGSTGLPQPHQRSWGLLVSSAISAGHEIGAAGLPGAAIIGTVPHQHSYGLESLVMLALQHELVLHAERPFYPGDISARLAAAPRPRILVTTPIHLRLLLAEAEALPVSDLVLSATAPLSADLARNAEARFEAPLYEIYGCSEVGQLAFRRTTDGDEWRCLDRIALRQDGSATWAGGPAIAIESRLADFIELRDPWHFKLLGRTTDIVNIGGKRSSLAHLNARLNAIEGVRDGAFLIADETGPRGARMVAFAVAPGLTPSAVLAALRRHIDPAFLPRPLYLVDSLQRNALGKLTQDTVVQMLAAAGRS